MPLKLKAISLSILVILVALVSVILFVRETIKDEGLGSVGGALDRLFGPGGFKAKKVSFSLNKRTYVATDATLNLSEFNKGDPSFSMGPVTIDKLTILEPLMPMALNDLASLGEKPFVSSEKIVLAWILTMEGISFSFKSGGKEYRASLDYLVIRPLTLGPAPPLNPSGALGVLKNMRAESLLIKNLQVSAVNPSFGSESPARSAGDSLFEAFLSLRIHSLSFRDLGAFGGEESLPPTPYGLFQSLYSKAFKLVDARLKSKGALIVAKSAESEPGGEYPMETARGLSILISSPEDEEGRERDGSLPGSPAIEISVRESRLEGARLKDAAFDLLYFISPKEGYGALSSVPLSVFLIPPFAFDRMTISDLGLSLSGERIFELKSALLKGPFLKGDLAENQEIVIRDLYLNPEGKTFGLAIVKALASMEERPSLEGPLGGPLGEPLEGPLGGEPSYESDKGPEGPQLDALDPDGGGREGKDANGDANNAVAQGSLRPQGLLPISLSVKTLYHRGLGSLILPEFKVSVKSLFSLEGSLVFLGVDRGLLSSLKQAPLRYPGTLLRERSFGKLSLAGLSLSLSDKGLFYKILSSRAKEKGVSLEEYVDGLQSGISFFIPAKLDPLTENSPLVEAELISFIRSPESLFLAFNPLEPIPILKIREELISPLLSGSGKIRREDLYEFLGGDSLSFGANGDDPVIVLWRETPQAFDNDINPENSRYDGLGDLE
jgi:hypothetical protein